MRYAAIVAIVLLLAGASPTLLAATVEVDVGGYSMSGGDYYGGGMTDPVLKFSPSTVTINVGDSVVFKNQPEGGLQVGHNVHADDDSFRCSNGCRGDGTGATGDIAFNQWIATVKFTQAGTVTYHCDNHGNMGMVGTIIVKSVATAQNITGGISGNWFNPAANQGGHGFQIEVLPNNGMLAIWFVFNPGGTQQNWIYAQGSYDPSSNTTTLPAFLEQGGAFPPNFDSSKLSVPAWGSLTFTFSDCSNGTVTWTPNATAMAAGYAATSFSIQRLTSIATTACP